MQGLRRRKAICRDRKMVKPVKQRVFTRRSRTTKECTGILNQVKLRFGFGMEANGDGYGADFTEKHFRRGRS